LVTDARFEKLAIYREFVDQVFTFGCLQGFSGAVVMLVTA
jgi:hypothetical protein